MQMNIIEPITVGLNQIRANKLRSLLSLIGILIAVGSVTGIVSIGEGLRATIVDEFESIGGSTLVWAWPPNPWYRNQEGRWVRRNWEEYLTYHDVDAIMAETDKVEFVSPSTWISGSEWTTRYRSASMSPQIVCTDNYFTVWRDWQVAKGRLISVVDLFNRAKICIIGSEVAKNLFGDQINPLEKEVKIGTSRYTVVGVMESKTFMGDNSYDNQIMIPITTAQRRVFGNDHLAMIMVKVEKPEYVADVADAMRRVFRRLHRHGDEFGVETGERQLEQINKIILIMKAVAGGIAGISLIVGGIGIMNIMLVSVTERTREIGIRKAIGARNANILWQFIVEAVVLCLAGGILGIVLGLLFGWGIATYISSITGQTFRSVISPGMMFFSVGFSVCIGIVFGVYPAYQASRLDPVEALRHE